MAKTVSFFAQCERQEKVLPLPKRPWPLYRGLQRLEGADRRINLKREVAEVCEEGWVQPDLGTIIGRNKKNNL